MSCEHESDRARERARARESPLADWGFTWVPCFLMLSAFTLTHSRLRELPPSSFFLATGQRRGAGRGGSGGGGGAGGSLYYLGRISQICYEENSFHLFWDAFLVVLLLLQLHLVTTAPANEFTLLVETPLSLLGYLSFWVPFATLRRGLFCCLLLHLCRPFQLPLFCFLWRPFQLPFQLPQRERERRLTLCLF